MMIHYECLSNRNSFKRMKIAPLTSLRFFAALGVFLIHYNQLFMRNTNDLIVALRPIFSEGYLWVGFFFILSGFIISYSQDNKKNKDSPFSFLTKRLARIYPVHLLMLLFFCLYFYDTWVMGQQLSIFYNIFLVQSLVPASNAYWGYNAVSWSISTEAIFYIAFIFLLPLKTKHLLSLFIIITLTILLSHMYDFKNRDIMVWFYYINPISRSVDFMAGMLLYRLHKIIKEKGIRIAMGGTLAEITSIIVMIIFMAIAIKTQFTKSLRYDLYYLLPMSLIVITFSFSNGVISKFLCNSHLILLGEASFCLYMIHQPLISIISRKIITSTDSASLSEYAYLMPAMLMLSVMISIIIHVFYEKPLAKKIPYIIAADNR